MPTQYVVRRSGALPATAKAGAAVIYVDSDDNLLKIVPGGTGSTTEVVVQTGTGNIVTPTAATTLTPAQSGSDVMLTAAAGFAITLPAPAAGLRYTFRVGALFATTNYTIITPTANIIFGGAVVNSVLVPADTEDTITFVATADTIGDYVTVTSDGTNWYASGVGAQAGSITFTFS